MIQKVCCSPQFHGFNVNDSMQKKTPLNTPSFSGNTKLVCKNPEKLEGLLIGAMEFCKNMNEMFGRGLRVVKEDSLIRIHYPTHMDDMVESKVSKFSSHEVEVISEREQTQHGSMIPHAVKPPHIFFDKMA